MPKAKTRTATRKLKVFRTPIGFHDAYVAAPSQKAALEAWGSDANLFTRGAAEEVTEPKLTKAPLATPGEVIKVLRGTEAEQIRALEKEAPKANKRAAPTRAQAPPKPKKRGPRPSRTRVERAEKALAAADDRNRAAVAKIKQQIESLERRRREIESEHRSERERLQERLEVAREEYAKAMADWADA